jgi:hypothetical protein
MLHRLMLNLQKSGFYVVGLVVDRGADPFSFGRETLLSEGFSTLFEAGEFLRSLPETTPAQITGFDGANWIKFNSELASVLPGVRSFSAADKKLLELHAWEHAYVYPALQALGYSDFSSSALTEELDGIDCRVINCKCRLSIGAMVSYTFDFAFFYY